MRCVVCGRAPSEECNEKTHAAHDRMWLDLPRPPVLVDVADLKQRRLGQGLSLEELGKALGYSGFAVRSWEDMGHAPTIRTQYAWRDLLTTDT